MEENFSLEWQAFDKPEKEHKVDWFWALGIIGIAGSILAFIFDNFLFGVFILLSVIVLIFFVTQKPTKVSYKFDEKGFHHEKNLIPYEKIISFYLDEEGDWNKLILEIENPLTPLLSFFYEDDKLSQKIYEILEDQGIEEKYLIEPISQQIFDKLGF